MEVGMMRNYNKPSSLSELMAIASQFRGIQLIYIHPKDIIPNRDKVIGKTFINNTWLSIETKLPKFIDISPFCFSRLSYEQEEYLRNNTMLSDDNSKNFNKKEFQYELSKDEKFSDLVIPTISTNKFKQIEEFLELNSKVILKPISGQFGAGVYLVEKDGEDYSVSYEYNVKSLNKMEFYNFYMEEIHDNKYIIQKFIDSRSVQGHPYDCRINVEKNGEGEWTLARKFIRIGIGQKVVSNISQGGGVSNTIPFLKSNFPKEYLKIERKLEEVGKIIPKKVEELRGTTLMTLAIDVGIDKNGEVYIFEVNSAPGTTQLRDRIALIRSDYYKYVLLNGVK